MSTTFTTSAGLLSIVKSGIHTFEEVLGNWSSKASEPTKTINVDLKLNEVQIKNFVKPALDKAMSFTNNRPAAREALDFVRGKLGKNVSTNEGLSILIAKSIIFLAHEAKESVGDFRVLERLSNSGLITKFALHIIQYVRGLERVHNIPLSNVKLSFGIGSIEPEKPQDLDIDEAFFALRLFAVISRGEESGLIKPTTSLFYRNCPGFFTVYYQFEKIVSVTKGKDGKPIQTEYTKPSHIVKAQEATTYDECMALMLGVQTDFDRTSNLNDSIILGFGDEDPFVFSRQVLSDFILAVNMFAVPENIVRTDKEGRVALINFETYETLFFDKVSQLPQQTLNEQLSAVSVDTQ